MPNPANLVHQTTTTTGAGNLTMAAVNGKATFVEGFGTGGTNTFDYFISNRDAASEREWGTGHESAGALVRDTVVGGSNGTSPVNFSAGTKDIVNDVPASRQTYATQAEAQAGVLHDLIMSPLRVKEAIDALAFSTGDIKSTLKATADSGWVMMDDKTIGNAASGGTGRANADTVGLFTLIWNNVSDTYAAVSSGRGANAAADYAANKTIALPKLLGRALASAGAGSGLTSRALGQTAGAETVALSTAELPSHTHGGVLTGSSSVDGTLGGTPFVTSVTSGSTGSTGSGTAHANVQPTTFVNFMVKL